VSARNLPSPKELLKLLKAVLAGDEQAQHALYEMCNPQFRNFARKFLLRHGCSLPDHSSEITDSAWSSIFINLGALRQFNSFIPWGLRIVRNEAYGHLRQCIATQQHEVPIDSLNKRASDESQEKEITFEAASIVSTDKQFFAALLAREILELAKEISTKLYDILYLQMTEDLDLFAVAQCLGISYGSARTIRSRGIRELKKRLAEKSVEEKLKKRLAKKKKDIE
jgi:RNA polymerase sigma factor (sigma-70 family)